MCTSIVEIVGVEGMAKRGDEWFPLTQAVVAYDHARHAPAADVITLDFINTGLEPGARAGVELTLESAKECVPRLIERLSPPSSRRRKCGARARCQPYSGSVTPGRNVTRRLDGFEQRLTDRVLRRYFPDWPHQQPIVAPTRRGTCPSFFRLVT